MDDVVSEVVTFSGDYTGADEFEDFEEVKSHIQKQLDDAGVEAEVDITENNEIIIKSKSSGSDSKIEISQDNFNIIGGNRIVEGTNEAYKGEEIGNNLSEMDASINKYAELRSQVGGKLQRTGNIIDRLEANEVHLRSLKSKNEDADLAEVITELKMEETVYRASLASGSRIMQQSLVDFIR